MNADGLTALAVDYLNLDSLFSADELELRDRIRAFVDARIRPSINAWYEAAYFPRELAPELGALGVLGMNLEGYGCPGRSAVEYGLAMLELEAGDSGAPCGGGGAIPGDGADPVATGFAPSAAGETAGGKGAA